VVLFGGFALPYFGVERLTMDVDFMITENDFEPFAAQMRDLGYQLGLRTPQFARFICKISGNNPPDVDTVFVDPPVMDAIWAEATVKTESEIALPVASLKIMLGTKLHALKYNRENRRQRYDLADITGMLQAAGVDPKGAWFKEICERYGSMELWDMICQQMK